MDILIKFEDNYGCKTLFEYSNSCLRKHDSIDILGGFGDSGVFNITKKVASSNLTYNRLGGCQMKLDNGKMNLSRRISHIDRVRKAYIMWEDIPIAEIYHEYSSLSGEADWVIKPIWENWDKARERGEYVDIAGIDDTKRKAEYIRRYTPEFVTQRTIPEGREDLFPLLKEIGLTHNDLYEVLCRTHGICGNDDYYVSRTPDKIININTNEKQFDIPDFDTNNLGWIN